VTRDEQPSEEALVEIPEHLLKRSRERRAALGLGGDAAPAEGGAAAETPASAAVTPAASAAAATPAPAAPVEEAPPAPPKPDPLYVQAAKRRRRIPYWAMPVLAGIPLWGYVFYSTLSPPPAEADPVTLGGQIYTSAGCAGCHGGTGTGTGAVPALADGAVLETWPDFRDQMLWVRVGTDGWMGETYGAQAKPLGGGGNMPEHASLSDEELAQVVLYERRELSGEEPPEGEEDVLMMIAEGEMTFAEAEIGPLAEEAGFTEQDLEGG
jgi:mono/diheme cytochrome c family protein